MRGAKTLKPHHKQIVSMLVQTHRSTASAFRCDCLLVKCNWLLTRERKRELRWKWIYTSKVYREFGGFSSALSFVWVRRALTQTHTRGCCTYCCRLRLCAKESVRVMQAIIFAFSITFAMFRHLLAFSPCLNLNRLTKQVWCLSHYTLGSSSIPQLCTMQLQHNIYIYALCLLHCQCSCSVTMKSRHSSIFTLLILY